MKKGLAILVALGILGLFGWQVYRRLAASAEGPGGRLRSVAVAVAVEPVRRETIRDVAEFTGTLLAKSHFVIAPKVPGRLEKLMSNIGDSVNSGDLVAVLESEEYAQQVAQAQAELEVSRANVADCRSALEVAQREFERVTELRQQKVASEAELDQADARYKASDAKHEVALAQIKQKEAALKTAEVRLSYTRIQAAWEDGDEPRVIAERFVDEGAMLKANDPIVSIVDVSLVTAVIYVIERDFPEVRVGQSATITTDAYPNRQFTGRIVRRAPVLKEESRQARVEIEIPNPEGLLAPGMFVRARIQFAEREDATVVPASALVRRNGRQGVFLADTAEMKGRFVPVKLGIVNGDSAEVLEPPLDGLVVSLGQHLLDDGASITLPDMEPAAADTPAASPQHRPRESRP